MSAKRWTPARIAKAVAWRLLRRQRMMVYRGNFDHTDTPQALGELELLHLKNPSVEWRQRIVRLHEECGETTDTGARFDRGDQFFALLEQNRIIAFKWVTFASSDCGTRRLQASPKRAFIYNAFTREPYRGRGLAGALDSQLVSALVKQGRNDLVSGISAHNRSSLNAKRKRGYAAVAEVPYLVLLNHWRLPLPIRYVSANADELFRPSADGATSAAQPLPGREG